MEQDRDSATLVLLDAPAESELGLDLLSWTLGPRFKGVRGVPPGLCFLHYRQQDGSMTHGIFTRVQDVTAFRWDPRAEDYRPMGPNDASNLREAVRRGELASGLGPYEGASLAQWRALAGRVSERTLVACGIELDAVVTGMDLDGAPDGEGVRYVTPRFRVLPAIVALARASRRGEGAGSRWLRGADGAPLGTAEITALQMDPSPLVHRLLDQDYGGNSEAFLGEVQLAFLCFLYLAQLPALEFWKTAVHLVCSGEALRRSHTAFLIAFLDVLQPQLQMLPPELFRSELLQDNFLVEALAALLDPAADLDAGSRLRAAVKSLSDTVSERFGGGTLAQLAARRDAEENAFQVAAIHGESSLQAASQGQPQEAASATAAAPAPETRSPQRMAWMLPPPAPPGNR